jgi:hypothetical protein
LLTLDASPFVRLFAEVKPIGLFGERRLDDPPARPSAAPAPVRLGRLACE